MSYSTNVKHKYYLLPVMAFLWHTFDKLFQCDWIPSNFLSKWEFLIIEIIHNSGCGWWLSYRCTRR